jgi:hypothetical protein
MTLVSVMYHCTEIFTVIKLKVCLYHCTGSLSILMYIPTASTIPPALPTQHNTFTHLINKDISVNVKYEQYRPTLYQMNYQRLPVKHQSPKTMLQKGTPDNTTVFVLLNATQ